MVVPGAHRPSGGGAAGPIRPCSRVQELLEGGQIYVLSTVRRKACVAMGSGGMFPRENFENRVVFPGL